MERSRHLVIVIFALFLATLAASQVADREGAHQAFRVLVSLSACCFGVAGTVAAVSLDHQGDRKLRRPYGLVGLGLNRLRPSLRWGIVFVTSAAIVVLGLVRLFQAV